MNGASPTASAGQTGGTGAAAADWIALDASCAAPRAWAIGAEGTIRGPLEFPAQAGAGEARLPRIVAAIRDHWPEAGSPACPIVACGLPPGDSHAALPAHRPLPCPPLAADSLLPAGADIDGGGAIWIIAGLGQLRPQPGLTCGEETRIAGFLALRPDFDGVLCLASRRSLWARISAGEVVSMQSFMTGAMIAMAAAEAGIAPDAQPVPFAQPLPDAQPLPVSPARPAAETDPAAFEDGLSAALSRPSEIGSQLSALGAGLRLRQMTVHEARARLAGLAIGVELAAARPYWLGQSVALVGAADRLCDHAHALERQGVAATTHAEAQMTLAGLVRARGLMTSTAPPGPARAGAITKATEAPDGTDI